MRAEAVILADGSKNCTVKVTGWIDATPGQIIVLNLDDLKGTPAGLRLDSVIWLIEEKAGLTLWWGLKNPPEEKLILPMESRNSLRFDRPLDGPKDLIYIKIKTAKLEPTPKAFFLLLDFDKQ